MTGVHNAKSIERDARGEEEWFFFFCLLQAGGADGAESSCVRRRERERVCVRGAAGKTKQERQSGQRCLTNYAFGFVLL